MLQTLKLNGLPPHPAEFEHLKPNSTASKSLISAHLKTIISEADYLASSNAVLEALRESGVSGRPDSILASLYHCGANLPLYKSLITLREDIDVNTIDHFANMRPDNIHPAVLEKEFLQSTSALKFIGEKKYELSDVEKTLYSMSDSFKKPLWKLRQQYHTLDR